MKWGWRELIVQHLIRRSRPKSLFHYVILGDERLTERVKLLSSAGHRPPPSIDRCLGSKA